MEGTWEGVVCDAQKHAAALVCAPTMLTPLRAITLSAHRQRTEALAHAEVGVDDVALIQEVNVSD